MPHHHLLRTRAVCAYTVLIGLFLISSAAHGGGVRFVDDDASPGGDGTSWNTAYRFLQDALADASGGDVSDIRVAQGVYKPDRDEANPDGTGDREATFHLLNSVALMGGYAGLGAKDPDARDIELYLTIVSGDLLGNDGPDFEDYGENSYHVIAGHGANNTATLDGFRVTSGNANGTGDHRYGGGMYNNGGSPTVSNCTFHANSASNKGGGMANEFSSSPIVSNCIFTGNIVTNLSGGGMDNQDGSSPTVTNCTFVGNSAAVRGGGMYNHEDASPEVIGCVFSDNIADEGAGMFNLASSRPIVIDCLFIQNLAFGRGGGMYNNDFCDATVTNTSFVSNTSLADGGGMMNQVSNAIVTNCLFVDNFASLHGGAMYSRFDSRPGIANTTIVSNIAAVQAGGIYSTDQGIATVANSILYGNTGEQVAGANGAVTIVAYSNVQGGFEGLGNIDADPMFVAPGSGDYRLSAGSPCIDAAHNWGVPVDVNDYDEDGITNELFPVDLDGNPRFNADENDFDPGCGVPVVVDMGAYEYQFDPVEDVIFADLNGDGSVGVVDLLGLLGDWGPCAKGCCLADLDLNSAVGVADLLILLGNWG